MQMYVNEICLCNALLLFGKVVVGICRGDVLLYTVQSVSTDHIYPF